jgi:photosynthetic reaction center cytochrome c subunit
MNRIFLTRTAVMAVGGLGMMMLGGCEPGAKQTTQTGYRGSGGDQIVDIKHMVKTDAIPPAPYPLPADGGPKAGETYKNVKVLGGVSTERFNHLMAEISQWIAPPEQGCAYCHNPENMASDEKYTKIVARRMLQMTQTINSTWSPHVQKVGVTCYTCHRGNAVPTYKWAVAAGAPNPNSIKGNRYGQNELSPDSGYSDLPVTGFGDYLAGTQNIRVNDHQAVPEENGKGIGASIQGTEKSYGLMMHMSKSLGVNCTFCHNTQAFASWSLSRPQRATAWYGIRMVRDINNTYISSLTSVFPDYRKGPHGDPYKVNCMTCHQGQNKPLAGQSMLDQAPALWGPVPAVITAPPPAPAAPAVAAAAAPAPLAYNVPAGKTAEK